MRPKNMFTLCIIVFVLSSLLVNSVFAKPIDPEKEIDSEPSALETNLNLGQANAVPPEFSTAPTFYEKFNKTSAYVDQLSPPLWLADNDSSLFTAQKSFDLDLASMDLLQDTVQSSSPWQQLNEDGFGDTNYQIPAVEEFNGFLYAGTWKNVDEVNYAEVWRTPDGGNWEKVDERGHNGCADLIEFDGYLYCGSWDGYIWRSDDGITWLDVVTNGFGDPNNGIARFAVYNNMLYAGTWNGTPGAQIWRTNDGTNWTIFGNGLDPTDIVVGAISTEIFDGYLYWGAANWETGAQLWRTDGTTLTLMTQFTSPAISSLAAFDGYLYAGVWDGVSTQVWSSANGSYWTQLLTFSDLGSDIREANGLEVYDGMLYLVGSNPDTGLEVWRTGNGTDWEQVGFTGFGDPENGTSFWDNAITTFGGKLIISTNNYNTGGEVWAYVPNDYEVYDVGLWMNLGVKDWIWGNAIPGSDVTIITPHDTIYSYADPNCNGCFGINEPIELNPGDTITVTAGPGSYPVDFTIPTPLVINADSTTEQVTGQIGGWDTQTVAIHGWWENGDQEVTTDASGNFSAPFSDIPRGGEGYIHFPTVEDGADINYHQYFRTPDLIMEIYPFADQIEGQYAPGHELILTVNDSGDNLKAVATLTTGEIEWWGDRTGFATQMDDGYWSPSRPDIVPGDKIYGSVDGGAYQSYAQVGEITGVVDSLADRISGTINAPWLIPDPGVVDVECYPWGAPDGVPDKYDTVIPDGDPAHAYTCQWDLFTEWDVVFKQWIGVAYRDPQANRIIEGFYEPDYNLYLHVNYYGDAIEGSYPPGYEVTLTVLESDGITPKATTTITTTEVPWWNGDTGFSTELGGVVWDTGRPDIQAGDWVFGEVDVDGTIYTTELLLGDISGEVDTENDSITGTVDVPWFPQDVEIEIQCHPWGAPGPVDAKQDFVYPNGEDPYYCEWDPATEWDIQPNQDVGVTYADPYGHWVYNGFFAYSYELYLNINYDHDWIEGPYPPGYEVILTVTESDGLTPKATTTLTTFEIPWWGGGTGFSTNVDGVVWGPERPDIQPGDWVFGEVTVGETTYYAEVQLGTFVGELSAETDSYTGKLSVPWLDPEVLVPIQCHPWGGPEGTPTKDTSVLPDGLSEFTCDWTGDWDVQPGQNIGVLYQDPGGHWIFSAPVAYTDQLILNIQYDHDWIDGTYQAGHEIFLSVLDSLGVEKAHITLTSGYIDGWGGTTGFATYMEGATWLPNQPDIQPGDTIYGEVDGGTFTAEVKIGTVTADLDLNNDQVSGLVDADWLPQTEEVKVSCEIWESTAPPNKEDWVLPTGEDPYLCDWSGDGYDLNETSNLMVAYYEAVGHKVIGEFRYPAPRLRIEKWLENGEPGEGGNVTFNIQYRNEGDAEAVNAIITDTFVQGLTYLSDTSGLPKTENGNEVIWQLGNLAPDEWVNFYVFAHVDATEGNDIINTAVISSDGFDSGNPEDRTRTWQGTVIANNTHLNVGKDTWTWNPAPGQEFVYSVNVCNNGPTGSTELTLTETLPDAVTLVDWWGSYAGWEEVSLVEKTLTLMYPSIPGWSCRDVYMQVSLSLDAQVNDELVNTAVISAINDDPNEQDNEAWLYHNVGEPYLDLSISLNWHGGNLVPGGSYHYGIYFRNEGNIVVSGPIELTATLPPETTFAGWQYGGSANLLGEPVQVGNTLTWQVDSLNPGYSGDIEIFATIDPATLSDTELVHSAAIRVQDGEVNTDNNYASFTETVRGQGPNMRISKWGDWHGDSLNAWYNLQVENIGDETVEDVLVTDILPTEMELDGEISVNYWEPFDVNIYDGYFTVLLDRLEPGSNAWIGFNTYIPDGTPIELGTVLTNMATVTPDENDSYPGDNSDSFDLIYTSGPKPNLHIDKWMTSGEPGVGGNASFHVQYINQGGDVATEVVLTDTLVGMTYISDTSGIEPTVIGNEVTWVIGDLEPGDWVHFDVFVQIDSAVGELLQNTIEMTTTSPYLDGDPSERTSYWEGYVIENDTHLNVSKGTWTECPAPGESFMYQISVCNNGQTASSTLTLTETLPANTTYVNWIGTEPGWTETSQSGQTLELVNPTISAGSCYGVYVEVLLDSDAQPNDLISNTVTIVAENDLSPDDDTATYEHYVCEPYVDLAIWQDWHGGILVPGGQYLNNINFKNYGNTELPLDLPTFVTAVIPAGTTFESWTHWGWASVSDPVFDGDIVTWQVFGLDAGYMHTIEISLSIDETTIPGTILENQVNITEHGGEINVENNTASFSETVHDHGPNLRIHKWGDWHSHGDGHNAWYHIQVENIGDETIDDVVVTDILPEGMELDGDVGVGFWEYWEFSPGEGSFTVTLDRLEPGWNVGMDFNVVIPGDDPVPWGQVFTNSASVTLDPADTNPEDNSAEYVLGTGTDMFVDKTWLNGEFLPGEQVEFLLVFGNKQPGHTPWWNMTGNAILVDTLPEGMTFVSSYWHCYQEEEWCEITPEQDGPELTWTTWPIGAGGGHEILLTVTIDEELQGGNTLINTIEISSDQPTVDIDPFMENNTSSYDPEVDFEAPIFTSADNRTFAYGELGSFTITTSGFPTPMIWTDDGMLSWLSFIDQGDGTAILSGTPPDEGGVDYILFKAANGVTPDAEQSFTLTWEGKPDYQLFLPLILR